jgi:hypothetical protein
MPENKITLESRTILGGILKNTFDVPDDTPFSELLRKCDEIDYSRDTVLENANARLTKLLNKVANTSVKL